MLEFLNELKEDFERDRHEQYMIIAKPNGEMVGTIYAYDYKAVDAYAFITIFLVEGARKAGYGSDATVLLLNHLFVNLGLYKVYMDVYKYNQESMTLMVRGGFKEEGKFEGHRLFNGIRHDVMRYSIFRSDHARIEQFLKERT